MSKVYIYDYVEAITDNWHSGGGLVIVTDGTPQDAWDNYRNGNKDLTETLPEPDQEYSLAGKVEEKVNLFPDAGCC